MKQLLATMFLFAAFAALGGVSFIPPHQAVAPKKFELPPDLAQRLAADIDSAPFEYLDLPHASAIADYQIESGGQVYWCHLRDTLFVVPSDRPGHAKIKRVPAIGFLSQRLGGGTTKDGGSNRSFLRDRDLPATVIRALREFYANQGRKKK